MKNKRAAVLILSLATVTCSLIHGRPDLNTVSPRVLRRLLLRYGIPGSVAERVLLHRETLGFFEDIRMLPLLPGISKKNAEKLAQLLVLRRGAPTSNQEPFFRRLQRLRGIRHTEGNVCRLNHVGPLTLASLPGIDRTLACSVIRYRKKKGPFLHRWGILAVPGMTPDIYAQIRERIIPGTEKKWGVSLRERLQFRKGRGETSSELTLLAGDKMEGRFLMKTSHDPDDPVFPRPLMEGWWRIRYRPVQNVILRAGRIRTDSDPFLNGVVRASLPSAFTQEPESASGRSLFSRNRTAVGAGASIRAGNASWTIMTSSAAFKADYETESVWVSGEENLGRFFQTTFRIRSGSRRFHIRFHSLSGPDAVRQSLLSIGLDRKTKNLGLQLASAVRISEASPEPSFAWLSSLRYRGQSLRVGVTLFASSPAFLPIMEEERGALLFPGRGIMTSLRLGSEKKNHINLFWRFRETAADGKMSSIIKLSGGIGLTSVLCTTFRLQYGERGPESAEIWAPFTIRWYLRKNSGAGSVFRTGLILAPGRNGTGSAVETRFRIPLSGRIDLFLWAAAGKPVRGGPLSLLPPGLPGWGLPLRNCFRTFRTSACTIRLAASDIVTIAGTIHLFRDSADDAATGRIQADIRL